MVAVANKPDPANTMGSDDGMFAPPPPERPAALAVIGAGYVRVSLVAVKFSEAKNAPLMVRPEPVEVGSATCALWFVVTSLADGGLKRLIWTWAKLLGANAKTSIIAINPTIHLLDFILFSPFEVCQQN